MKIINDAIADCQAVLVMQADLLSLVDIKIKEIFECE